MGFEVEAKFYIDDVDTMLEKLSDPYLQKTKRRIFERNFRYENEESTLTPNGIVLRLREDDRVRLTYKEPLALSPEGVIAREEWELQISDLPTMQVILNKLGYHISMVYEKFRTTYQINGVEIVLDELPYGNFLEIEGAAEFIEAAAVRLGLQDTKRITMSYTDLFEVIKTRLGLPFTDLTFENFQGIDVPESIFLAL